MAIISEVITAALQDLYPPIMTKIRFSRSPKPTKAEKAALGKTGFVVVATRWVIERSNAWIQGVTTPSKPRYHQGPSPQTPLKKW